VRTILEAFDRPNLLALGERHWSRQDSEFRIALIRDPAFAGNINCPTKGQSRPATWRFNGQGNQAFRLRLIQEMLEFLKR
jgi:hypothetical protein